MRASAPRLVPHVDLAHIAPITVTVGDAVEELLDELPRVQRLTFRELTASLVDRMEVVVRFLAVLELFKQDLVDLDQGSTFGDIIVVWTGGTEARSEGLEIDVYDG